MPNIARIVAGDVPQQARTRIEMPVEHMRDEPIGEACRPHRARPDPTVSNRSMEAGKAALTLLMDMLRSNAIRDVLSTHLVIRNTTARRRPDCAIRRWWLLEGPPTGRPGC